MCDLQTTPVVAVIGAGIMGAGIAQALAVAGCDVRLNDVDEAALRRGMDTIENGRFGIRRAVARNKMTAADGEAALARIRPLLELGEACRGIDVAVEAVPEFLDLKCEIFRKMDEASPAAAILTSNAAGLPITALAWATRRPARVLGWHWAQPAPIMVLAEIIVHAGTDPDACETISALARRCGKNPIVIKDQPEEWGFVANRINRAVRIEARRVVEEGVATEDQVDTIMKDCFRWPMGPFEMQRPGSMK